MSKNMKQHYNFAIFTFLWSAATISHQYSYGLIFSSVFDLLLTIVAILTLIRPSVYQLFLAQVFLQSVTIFIYLPNVFNHWFLAFCISTTIFLNYMYLVLKDRTLKTVPERLYNSFAPVLRIILIIVYFAAFFHKLNTDYFSVDTSCAVIMYLKLQDIYSFLPSSLFVNHFFVYLSLLVEVSIPVLLFFRRTRMAGILAGLYAHLIFGIIGYLNFSIIMFALLSLYLPLNFAVVQTGSKLNPGISKNSVSTIYKPIFYITTILLVTIFIYDRSDYILNNNELYKNIWKILFSIFSLGLIFLYISKLGLKNYEWENNFFRINFINAMIIILFIMNSFSPHLGYKTKNVFSMYSNLRTENNRSNHLLKDIFKIGGYQDDIVEVKESNIKRLKKERILPYAQLQNHIFNAERTKNKDILVKYNKDDELMNYKGDKDKIILKRFIPKYVKWKFFSFKPLSQSKTQNCGL